MEPQKVFEQNEKEPTVSGKFISLLLTALLVVCVGTFGLLWNMSKSITVLEDHDTQRSNEMGKMQSDINQLRSDMSEMKLNQALLNIKLQSNAENPKK